MSYQEILYEKKGPIAYLTLNRPDKLNAMNVTMLEDIANAVEEFESDQSSWVMILSGRGRSFCTGRDVSMFRDRITAPQKTLPKRTVGPPFLDTIKSGKPVIAAVQGHVLGLGIMLASECTILIASENAQFGMNEVKRSVSGASAWARITQWIPSKISTGMAITGDPISAEVAHTFGLVNKVTDEDSLLLEAEIIAQSINSAPPLAVRATVQAIRNNANNGVNDRVSRNPLTNLEKTEDYREAIIAFLEKRSPQFKGK
jgi:enoyl-CoA hydratase/carnithine racemase